MMNTGHAPIPRHLVWGDIGHARFPVCIGPGEISRIGDLWTERAVGDAALVVFDGAVAAHAQVVEDHLRAAGVRVVPVAVPRASRRSRLPRLSPSVALLRGTGFDVPTRSWPSAVA